MTLVFINMEIETIVNDKMVVIYQMGKVASSTIKATLAQIKGLNVIHTHHLSSNYTRNLNSIKRKMGWKTTISPESIDDLYNKIIHENEIYIISLVREPIGRNISAYFQNLDLIFKQDDAYKNIPFDQVLEGFFTKYPHSIPITWFDNEFNEVLGFDIYNHDFPKDEGAVIINNKKYHILVMRHDIDDEKKQKYLQKLLNIKNIKIIRKNEASSKSYFEIYAKFIDKISFSDDYINNMLESKYTKHFFSIDDIEYLKSKWIKNCDISAQSQI